MQVSVVTALAGTIQGIEYWQMQFSLAKFTHYNANSHDEATISCINETC